MFSENVQKFLDEETVRVKRWGNVYDIYQKYCEYCNDRDEEYITGLDFSQELKDNGFEITFGFSEYVKGLDLK